MESSQKVGVGTAVIVTRWFPKEWDRKILIGKRKGSHAAGLYSFPGGHLEFGETWEACALRELQEECGSDLKVHMHSGDLFITNDIMPQYGKHYITIFMWAEWIDGETVNMEPEKCEGWEWVTFEELEKLTQQGASVCWIPMDILANKRYREILEI